VSTNAGIVTPRVAPPINNAAIATTSTALMPGLYRASAYFQG
jgi:hypothetical protein